MHSVTVSESEERHSAQRTATHDVLGEFQLLRSAGRTRCMHNAAS